LVALRAVSSGAGIPLLFVIPFIFGLSPIGDKSAATIKSIDFYWHVSDAGRQIKSETLYQKP
jgi:hypothetical protein